MHVMYLWYLYAILFVLCMRVFIRIALRELEYMRKWSQQHGVYSHTLAGCSNKYDGSRPISMASRLFLRRACYRLSVSIFWLTMISHGFSLSCAGLLFRQHKNARMERVKKEQPEADSRNRVFHHFCARFSHDASPNYLNQH